VECGGKGQGATPDELNGTKRKQRTAHDETLAEKFRIRTCTYEGREYSHRSNINRLLDDTDEKLEEIVERSAERLDLTEQVVNHGPDQPADIDADW
jgi:hypothetical protein